MKVSFYLCNNAIKMMWPYFNHSCAVFKQSMGPLTSVKNTFAPLIGFSSVLKSILMAL